MGSGVRIYVYILHYNINVIGYLTHVPTVSGEFCNGLLFVYEFCNSLLFSDNLFMVVLLTNAM